MLSSKHTSSHGVVKPSVNACPPPREELSGDYSPPVHTEPGSEPRPCGLWKHGTLPAP